MAEKSRREFLRRVIGTAAAASFLPFPSLSEQKGDSRMSFDDGKRKVYVFSKNLQWLNYSQMAEFAAECGFDGIDLTVRPEGHVEPKRVEEELPKAVDAVKKSGLEIRMITTSILRADDPHAYATLRTAARLGIAQYRMGWHEYPDDKSLSYTWQTIEVELQKLASLNKQVKIKGCYQNHEGNGVGASVWDIGMLIHKVNSPHLGIQYDVRHATVEGANSWVRDFEYVKPFIHSLDIKDFTWEKRDGRWQTQNVPLGEGAVNFDRYFELIAKLPPEIPLCIHYEYPLGGAENGSRTLTLDARQVMDAMKKDLNFVRERI